ncbi:MAG: hypothetical protein GEV10_27085 [Streptosporangiales bacterium]|nr:hypothetical protein [Streptosporangiales bacterium]
MGTDPVAVTLMRGGTSKGVYCRLPDLPPRGPELDSLVLALLGSPDPMQLDGLGGTHSSTSKLMVVGTTDEARDAGWPVSTDDVDLAYAFAQVGIATPVVDWMANCGNLTAAVAPYAALQGVIETTNPLTRVRMLNLNTSVVIEVEFPTENGEPAVTGDHVIPGVPGAGARIDIRFLNPAGGDSGRPVLPTGRRSEIVHVGTEEYEVSILDVNNPVVVVTAASVGLTGSELPADLNRDTAFLALLDAIRCAAAVRMGLAPDVESAPKLTPGIPRVIVVSRPHDHISALGDRIGTADCDLVARMTSMGSVHHAMPGTGLTVVAVASRLKGTVAERVTSTGAGSDVRLAHPKGVVTAASEIDDSGATPVVAHVAVSRTARRLMTGLAYPRPGAVTG